MDTMQNKADKAMRAKQFLPFESLKGFHEYLKNKERVVVERKQLSNDEYEELNRKIKQVEKGMMIKVVYYEGKQAIEVEGMVTKIDLEFTKTVKIVDKSILIKDIVEISGKDIVEKSL